jgi:hypothetical protein
VTEQQIREPALHRILWELRPYLRDIVIIGGWVPHLYRRHGGFGEWRARLSGTAEVDVLLTDAVADPAGRPSLAAILEAAHFECEPETRGAIWRNDPASGEKIEFFVPLAGTAMSAGRTRDVPGQEGLGAMGLSDIDLLSGHTRILQVPLLALEAAGAVVDVRVPSLGAYLVIKSSTFMSRSSTVGGQAGPRRAKDIVYIRDVMAAGAEVVNQVTQDLAQLREQGARTDVRMRTASNHLGLLDRSSAILRDAAAELGERDEISETAAALDLLGHITDLRELLESSERAS